MDNVFGFILEHVWAPILAVVGWFINDREKKRDLEIAMLNKKIERQQAYINDKLVKKDDLRDLIDAFRDDMTYIRGRLDLVIDGRKQPRP